MYENSVPARATYDEGRVVLNSNGTANINEAYLKDHLGNIRVVYYLQSGSLKTQQVNSYYPFGMNIKGLSANGSATYKPNEYLYNGKMMQDEMGLGWLDYGARFYDGVLGRWWSVDPLAEEYRNIAPFVYCLNNPVVMVDPNGESPTLITGAIGFGVGALIGGAIEMGTQLYNNGSVNNWTAVGGSALQGGITGGVAGLTGGASLLATATAAGGANVVGGALNRTIQGKETSLSNIITDATVGAVFGAGGKLIGSGLSSLSSSLSKQATSKLTYAATKVLSGSEEGSGAVYGIKAHVAFAKAVNGMKIGDNVIKTEVSYLDGEIVKYGTKGSARIDAGLYNSKGELIQVFDLKTGGARLTSQQVQHIQIQTRTQVSVTEIRGN